MGQMTIQFAIIMLLAFVCGASSIKIDRSTLTAAAGGNHHASAVDVIDAPAPNDNVSVVDTDSIEPVRSHTTPTAFSRVVSFIQRFFQSASPQALRSKSSVVQADALADAVPTDGSLDITMAQVGINRKKRKGKHARQRSKERAEADLSDDLPGFEDVILHPAMISSHSEDFNFNTASAVDATHAPAPAPVIEDRNTIMRRKQLESLQQIIENQNVTITTASEMTANQTKIAFENKNRSEAMLNFTAESHAILAASLQEDFIEIADNMPNWMEDLPRDDSALDPAKETLTGFVESLDRNVQIAREKENTALRAAAQSMEQHNQNLVGMSKEHSPQVLKLIPAQHVQEGHLFELDLNEYFYHSDGNEVLEFKVEGLPTGISLAEGKISGYGMKGLYGINVQATDNVHPAVRTSVWWLNIE